MFVFIIVIFLPRVWQTHNAFMVCVFMAQVLQESRLRRSLSSAFSLALINRLPQLPAGNIPFQKPRFSTPVETNPQTMVFNEPSLHLQTTSMGSISELVLIAYQLFSPLICIFFLFSSSGKAKSPPIDAYGTSLIV